MNRWGMHLLLAATAFAGLAPGAALGHFIWLRVEPKAPSGGAAVRMFFNEDPHPEAPEYLRFVREVNPAVAGAKLTVVEVGDAMEARWLGRAPLMVDAERDLGVIARGGAPHRLVYTARAQTEPVEAASTEALTGLRVRLVNHDAGARAQVLFDGKPVANARIKVYPEDGDAFETNADGEGLADIAGLVDGKAAIWANWNDATSGEVDGKTFDETRHYATLTFQRAPASLEGPPTQFATMPEPAVNSFGGAVLGDWLYVYGGHLGEVHHYSDKTTSRHFRRLNLRDGRTWEDLPMERDLQGVALVSDGRFLYRTGGMNARNAEGEDHDMHSVAEFARFDPETRTWEALAPMPEARSTHDSAIVGRTLYVVGGWTMQGASSESVFCKNALAIDLDHPEQGWRAVEQPFQRRALAAAAHGGKLYVVGGLLGSGMNSTRKVDVFDPASGSWSEGPALPGLGRHEGFAASAFEVDGRLYASGASGNVFRLSCEGDRWEPVGRWFQPRITHRILPGLRGALLAVGGNHRGIQTPVIERLEVAPGAIANPTVGQR